jgi:WD40 repeat protein
LDGLALINLQDGLFYPIHTGSGLFDEVTRLEFSSDSMYLAQSFYGAIYLWDVEAGVQVRSPITGNLSPASISPDNQYVAYFTKYQLRVEDLETGANRLPIYADGTPFFPTGIDHPSYQPFDLTIQEDGQLLVFYRNLNRTTFEVTVTMIEWDIATVTGQVRIPRLIRLSDLDSLYTSDYENERPQRIPSFGLSPSENYIHAMTQDGIVRVFDANVGRHIASSSSDFLDRMAISPDGDYVAMPDALGRIQIYDIASGLIIQTIDGSWFPVWMQYNSPSILMILQEDRTLSFVDTQNGRTLQSITDARFEAGRYKALSRDGELLAILQLEAGSKQLFVFPLSPDGPLYNLGTFPLPYIPEFSPDGKTIAVIDRNQVDLWSIPNREMIMNLEGLGTSIGGLTFTPDGLTLIASTGEIWDLETQQKVNSLVNAVPRMEIRTNGRIILSQDGQVWDIESGDSLGTIPGLRGNALHFGFFNDGQSFYWQSPGGIVEFWGRAP